MTATTYQTLSKQFEEFDRLIRPKQATLDAARAAHLDVRSRISNDDLIQRVHVADFLQGSYARHTMILPRVDERGNPEKADVDIVLVTSVPETVEPYRVLGAVEAWLKREYGEGSAEIQSRSVKLTLPDVEVDLVPTSAPSEALNADLRQYAEKALKVDSSDPNDVRDSDEVFGPQWGSGSDGKWREEPLRIPDIHASCWQDTHPLATLDFTVEKNKACDKKFLAVARALKWWRRRAFEAGGQKHPKSYPVEHMAGDYCPEGIKSVAEGLAFTFSRMRDDFAHYYPHSMPHLHLRGLEWSDANVISRLTQEDFNAFYEELNKAAVIANNALLCADARQAASLWRELLGEKLPLPVLISNPKLPGGYAAPVAAVTEVRGGRFG